MPAFSPAAAVGERQTHQLRKLLPLALDTLEPNPIPALLSAEEARARLREVVEGFFFRRRDEQGQLPTRHLLVRSPPGLGKTTEAMDWATRYQAEQEEKEGFLKMSRLDITPAGAR